MKRMMSKKKATLPSLRNHDWKTALIENRKNKQIINKYLNDQHHRIKRSKLCMSEISL